MNEEQEREKFEAWVVKPPYSCNTTRFSSKASKAYVGKYFTPEVDLAWEAWKAAVKQSELRSGAGEPIPCKLKS